MPLTDKQIKAIKPEGKAKKYFDGGGLYLEVTASGNKMWRLKYRVNSVEKRISLGAYPVGKTTLYKEIAEGRFPPQIKLGRSAFWDAVEVRRFLKNAGATVSVPE